MPEQVSKEWIEGKKELQKTMQEEKADAEKEKGRKREQQRMRDFRYHVALPKPKQLPATAKRRARENKRDDLVSKRYELFYASAFDRLDEPESEA